MEEFKISRRRRPRKRRLKTEFALFQSPSRLLQLIYFVKCKRTLLKPKNHVQVQKEEKKNSRHLFTSSKKLDIRLFPVVAMQWRQRNVLKKRDARAEDRAELLFFLFNRWLLWRSSCRRRRIIFQSL